MMLKKVGKLSLFTTKCIIIFVITGIAGLGLPFFQTQMKVSVDGIDQVVLVDGIYMEHLQQKIGLGKAGDDYKFDQPFNLTAFLKDTQTIGISTKKVVELRKQNETKKIQTYVHSLTAFLEEQNIEIVPPTETTEKVTRLSNQKDKEVLKTGTILEEVVREDELAVEYRDNAELEEGKEQVVQEGQQKKTAELFKTDDVSKNVMLSSKVIQDGVSKIIEKGTKKVVTPVTAASNSGSTSGSSIAPAVPTESVWDQLAACESGGRWNVNTGNGYYGGLQFSAPTWTTASKKVGLNIEYAHLATREEQIMAATWLQNNSGWGQWPSCTSKLGLR